MAYLNKVFLLGNLGRDPEIKVTQNAKKFARFTLATTKRYRAADGETKEDTQWHSVTFWGNGAETIERLDIRKGAQLLIEGEVTYRKWDDNGVTKYATDILGNTFQLLTPRQSTTNGTHDHARPNGTPATATAPMPQADEEDDLPF